MEYQEEEIRRLKNVIEEQIDSLKVLRVSQDKNKNKCTLLSSELFVAK